MMRAHVVALCFACVGCKNSESIPSTPAPPKPAVSPAPILSPFTDLADGGGTAITPGAPLMTFDGRAIWWEHGKPVTVVLPEDIDPKGSRWLDAGKTLRIGLGTLDLGTRTWSPVPGLQSFTRSKSRGVSAPVRDAVWFGDAKHVALVLESRDGRMRASYELVIADVDGKVRGRVALGMAPGSVRTSADRVLVDDRKLTLYDLDAKPIAELDIPVGSIGEGAGMFAVAMGEHGVSLVRASDGSVVATWKQVVQHAIPVENGIVAAEFEGKVHVGCIQGDSIHEVSSVDSGVRNPTLQFVGDRLAIAGSGPVSVRTATFANPCH